MSPRQSPATAHELSRIGLLATLPGQTLARLAARMRREEIAAGAAVGSGGDRFTVVLSGMLTATEQGSRRILRPGDHLDPGAAGTASVRALTPATIASCDRATFDELLRPLLPPQ